MANYSVPDSLLIPYLPKGLELDKFAGQSFVSLVAFEFLNTRVKGFSIPFHQNFIEVNLRFYVKRIINGETRRGVVFISEIVPKFMIAFVANKLYGERYSVSSMSYSIKRYKDNIDLQYNWNSNHIINEIKLKAEAKRLNIPVDSKEEFIAEHYWGYSKGFHSNTMEYQVAHPRWEMAKVLDFKIECNFEINYGKEFAFLNKAKPDSVFYFFGDVVTVFDGESF